MVVNNGYQIAPWADALYAADGRWWNLHFGAPKFKGAKYTIDHPISRRWRLNHVPNSDKEFFPGMPIARGKNSGYQALGLVASMGFKEIFLLGFDFKHTDKTHWFGDHPKGYQNKSPNFEGWLQDMRTSAPILHNAGIRVVNCSPDSALDMFEKMPIKDAI